MGTAQQIANLKFTLDQLARQCEALRTENRGMLDTIDQSDARAHSMSLEAFQLKGQVETLIEANRALSGRLDTFKAANAYRQVALL